MGILKRDLPVIIESIRNGRVYKKLLMLGNQKIYFVTRLIQDILKADMK